LESKHNFKLWLAYLNLIITARMCWLLDSSASYFEILNRKFSSLLPMFFDKTCCARIVQKPQPTENKAKKVANRPLLIPRMVFVNGELWEFN